MLNGCNIQTKSSGRSSFGSESHRSTPSTHNTFETPMGQRLTITKPHDHGKILTVLFSLFSVSFELGLTMHKCSGIAESSVITRV